MPSTDLNGAVRPGRARDERAGARVADELLQGLLPGLLLGRRGEGLPGLRRWVIFFDIDFLSDLRESIRTVVILNY